MAGPEASLAPAAEDTAQRQRLSVASGAQDDIDEATRPISVSTAETVGRQPRSASWAKPSGLGQLFQPCRRVAQLVARLDDVAVMGDRVAVRASRGVHREHVAQIVGGLLLQLDIHRTMLVVAAPQVPVAPPAPRAPQVLAVEPRPARPYRRSCRSQYERAPTQSVHQASVLSAKGAVRVSIRRMVTATRTTATVGRRVATQGLGAVEVIGADCDRRTAKRHRLSLLFQADPAHRGSLLRSLRPPVERLSTPAASGAQTGTQRGCGLLPSVRRTNHCAGAPQHASELWAPRVPGVRLCRRHRGNPNRGQR